MSENLEIKVEKDHLISLTKVSGITAISELIWNSLDADATLVEIKFINNPLSTVKIEISDNGHGMTYPTALLAFQTLGGSEKKKVVFSPKHRALHGKEGKGRLKAFALGESIRFISKYRVNSSLNSFNILLDQSNIQKAYIGDLSTTEANGQLSGVKVIIENINQENANSVLTEYGISQLEEKFAVYSMVYPNFKIKLNNEIMDFKKQILNTTKEKFSLNEIDKDKTMNL